MMSISFAVVGLCHDIVMMRESPGVNRERDMLAIQRKSVCLTEEEIPILNGSAPRMPMRLEGEADFIVSSLTSGLSVSMSRPNPSPFLCALEIGLDPETNGGADSAPYLIRCHTCQNHVPILHTGL